MPTITELITNTQDQVLVALKQGEDVIVDGLRSMSDAIEGFVPFLDQLPKPADAVESAFAFTNTVLASQRDLVESILKSVLPAAQDAAAATKTAATKAATKA